MGGADTLGGSSCGVEGTIGFHCVSALAFKSGRRGPVKSGFTASATGAGFEVGITLSIVGVGGGAAAVWAAVKGLNGLRLLIPGALGPPRMG